MLWIYLYMAMLIVSAVDVAGLCAILAVPLFNYIVGFIFHRLKTIDELTVPLFSTTHILLFPIDY